MDSHGKSPVENASFESTGQLPPNSQLYDAQVAGQQQGNLQGGKSLGEAQVIQQHDTQTQQLRLTHITPNMSQNVDRYAPNQWS